MSHSTPFLLAVDVGNSRIKCGLLDNSAADAAAGTLPRCLHAATVSVGKRLPWDEIADRAASTGAFGEAGEGPPRPTFGRRCPVPGIIAGVNPAEVRRVIESWPADGCNRPIVLDRPDRLPLRIHLPAPEKVGIDRLLNAVAANVVRPAGRAAIIVDIGTATTVDYLSGQGTFEGGAILPGFELSARSLHQHTALLPMIEIEELAAESIEPLGRNTRDALRSGLFWGQLGAVKELIERIAISGGETGFLKETGFLSSSSTNPKSAIGAPAKAGHPQSGHPRKRVIRNRGTRESGSFPWFC